MSTNCPQVDWPDDSAYFEDFFRRAEAARVPLGGSLELTRRCNLRCVHCYLGPQERVCAASDREMSTAQVISVLDQIVDAGCLELLITGGDPLLRRDFPEIYRHARLAGLAVTVFTNGTPVTERIVALFQDLPPRIVEITLYGATAETYERITGVPGSYRRCLAGVARLHAAGIRLGLKTVLMTTNSHELDAIERLALSFGAKFRFDPVLNACLDGGREPLGLRVEAGEAVRLEFACPERRRKWLDFHARYPVFGQSDRIYQCGAGQTGFHVDAYGNLHACLMLSAAACSLWTGTFAEGWARMAGLSEARAGAGNRCTSCQRRAYCGYCPGLLELENGDVGIPSPYLCALASERLRCIAIHSEEEKYEFRSG
jgi:radical SAM protein with 4Fe4S-binding SPASM domain